VSGLQLPGAFYYYKKEKEDFKLFNIFNFFFLYKRLPNLLRHPGRFLFRSIYMLAPSLEYMNLLCPTFPKLGVFARTAKMVY
jgi:hypothetical protein